MNRGTIKTNFSLSSTGYLLGSLDDGSNTYTYPCSTIFEWNIKNQDVVNGNSIIGWKLKVDATNLNKYDSDAVYLTAGGTASVNSGRSSSSYGDYSHASVSVPQTRVEAGEVVEVANGEFTVAHNSAGAKTLYNVRTGITIYGFYDEDGTSVINLSSYGNDAVGEPVSFVLDPIAKQGKLSTAPDFNDEESPTITYAIPKESTSAYVGIYISGEMMIPYRSVAVSSSSYTFRFSQTELDALWGLLARGLTTADVRFYIKTTCNGNTLEHYLPRTLTFINYKPTLDPEVYDTVDDIVDRLTGNKYILVRYASKPHFITGASGHKSATIDIQSVKNGATTIYGAEGTFDSVTDNIFTFAAVDNYGRSVTADMEFSRPNGYFVDYVRLTNSVTVSEMTADGDVQVTISGKYFDGSFGKRDNSMRMHYDIAQNNQEPEHVDMGYIYPSVTGSDYTYTFTISGLDYLSVYDLTVRVSDEISVEPAEAHTIVASTPIFDWGRQDFNFNVPVTIQGWQVDTVVEESTGEIGFYEDANGLPQYGGYEWTFRKWSSGLMECWCSVPITTNVSSAWGGLYTSGRLIQTNLLFPREFTEPPVVTATLAAGYAGGILMTTGSSSKPVTKYSAGTLEVARGTSYSNASYTINYNVKGRWK